MTIGAGTRLGPYEILSPLGAGGMGEVYRARDTRLGREVIVTVYDVGRADDTSYIAMELVEGKTVRELLAPGPLPVRRVLSLGAQVADGLAKAHAAGIVHRDLKPENLMVSSD